jgi:hypothetical protein
MALQRLVLTFKPGEIVMHALYRTQDGPGPTTKARARQVTDLVRSGLEQALEALEGDDVLVVGTSGFTTREDVLCMSLESVPESLHKKLKKGAKMKHNQVSQADRGRGR